MAVGPSPDRPYVVLDAKDCVLDVSPNAPAPFSSLLGQPVHEGFPRETEALYRPHRERARRTGEIVEYAQYSDGHVSLVRLVPTPRVLIASWEIVALIDVMTIEALRSSLDAALRALTEREEAVQRERTRTSLRVIAGGA